MNVDCMWMHRCKIPEDEGLQNGICCWHLEWQVIEILAHNFLQFLVPASSETEAATKSWWLTEVGQDKEINCGQILNCMMRHIQKCQHTPKEKPGSVGWGSKSDFLVLHIIASNPGQTACIQLSYAWMLGRLLKSILVLVNVRDWN